MNILTNEMTDPVFIRVIRQLFVTFVLKFFVF
jgi:hypothetical protein